MDTVDTTRFGTIEIDPTSVYTFPRGLIGFEQLKQYLLLDSTKGPTIRWLQSIERPEVAFILTEPQNFLAEYTVNLPSSFPLVADLDIKRVTVFTIVCLDRAQGTLCLNIQAPLILDPFSRKGMQVLTDVPTATISFPLKTS
jgi:flagellar assembly factor FliW